MKVHSTHSVTTTISSEFGLLENEVVVQKGAARLTIEVYEGICIGIVHSRRWFRWEEMARFVIKDHHLTLTTKPNQVRSIY